MLSFQAGSAFRQVQDVLIIGFTRSQSILNSSIEVDPISWTS